MSSVIINYSSLKDLEKRTRNTASKLNDYASELERKTLSKLNGLKGGRNSYINNCDYYTSAKIKKIKSKSTRMNNFSHLVSRFVDYAKDRDEYIARKLSNNSKNFKKNHDYIKDDWWSKLQGWLTDLKNSCPLFEAIGDLLNQVGAAYKDLMRDLRYWYSVGGGKETLQIVFAAIGVIVSAVLLVCAILIPGVNIIFAICGVIGAVIGVLNAISNLVSSVQAKKAHDAGDPAWAKVYSDRDTLSQNLKEVRWKGKLKWLNKSSYALATVIDVTQFICDVVSVVESVYSIAQIGKTISKVSKDTGLSKFKVAKRYITNKGVRSAIQSYSKPSHLHKHNMSSLAKTMKSIKKYTKTFKTILGYTEKNIDYTFGPDHSFSNFYDKHFDMIKDYLTDNYNSIDAIDKIKSKVIKKDYSNISSDVKNIRSQYNIPHINLKIDFSNFNLKSVATAGSVGL